MRYCRLSVLAVIYACAGFAWTQPVSSSIPIAAAFNFGSLSREAFVQHAFVVTNSGADPLVITKVRPSCDCLRVLSYPRQIAPKAAGAVLCCLAPDKVGDVSYKVFVESTDPNAPICAMIVEGRVIPASSGKGTVSEWAAAISPQFLCRVLTPRDESCYLTASTVQSRLGAGEDIRIIDVRPASAFNELHVPSSWNLTLFALKAQRQLQPFPLLLVDSCGGDPALEQACRDLRKSGFSSVWILGGGLNAWRRSGGALEGNPAAMEQLGVLAPSVFEQARHFTDWVVVTTGASQELHTSLLFPDAVPLDRIAGLQSLTGVGAAPVPSGKSVPTFNILLLADKGDISAASRVALLKKKADVHVYTLAGGAAGYEAYLKMCSAHPETRSLHAGAKTSLVRGTVVKKPCGGCSR